MDAQNETFASRIAITTERSKLDLPKLAASLGFAPRPTGSKPDMLLLHHEAIEISERQVHSGYFQMKASLRWLWAALVFAMLLIGAALFLKHDATNEMHPILDKLSSVTFGDRWAQPEMVKIRESGTETVPLSFAVC